MTDLTLGQFLAGIRSVEGYSPNDVPNFNAYSNTVALGPYGLTKDFIKEYAPNFDLPINKSAYVGNAYLQNTLAASTANYLYQKYGDWVRPLNVQTSGNVGHAMILKRLRTPTGKRNTAPVKRQ